MTNTVTRLTLISPAAAGETRTCMSARRTWRLSVLEKTGCRYRLLFSLHHRQTLRFEVEEEVDMWPVSCQSFLFCAKEVQLLIRFFESVVIFAK